MKGLMLLAAALMGSLAAHHAGEPKHPLAVDSLKAAGNVPVRYAGTLRGDSPADLAEIIPPARYSGQGAAIVVFADPPAMRKLCEGALACAWRDENGMPFIAMPNPCPFTANAYAVVMCHEKSHVLGWPARHGP